MEELNKDKIQSTIELYDFGDTNHLFMILLFSFPCPLFMHLFSYQILRAIYYSLILVFHWISEDLHDVSHIILAVETKI